MKRILFVTIVLIGYVTICFGQENSKWDNWNWIIGEWKGEGSGQPGQGSGTFSFSFDLDNNIIIRKSHSEYPASENRPETIHDDLMIVYLDQQGSSSNAIYFDNEGHTIHYTISFSDRSIILTSDNIPNTPIFRLVYTLIDSETVNTLFEMSRDGYNFMPYIEGKSKRTKPGLL